MKKETLMGDTINPHFSFRECCKVCGFPTKLPREPVLLTNNVLSLLEYGHNTCLSCGHQKDGSTIPIVHKLINELCNKFLKEREDLLRFLKFYHYADYKARRRVCINLPRFLNPNHKAGEDGDVLEPYSWNVVYIEVLHNTKLSKIMVRDIDWEKVC